MRTSIQLEDHIHEYASVYAAARGISLSAAINDLVRRAQTAVPDEPEILQGPSGLPMFPPSGRTITADTVKKLEEEGF